MGVDLSLMFFEPHHENSGKSVSWLGYNRLSFDRNYELQGFFGGVQCAQDTQVKTEILLTGLDFYGDDGIESVNQDSYGNPLKFFVINKQSRRIIEDAKLILTSSCWNKAILEFLLRLPDETKVVLWWH